MTELLPRQRKALEGLRHQPWENEASLGVGQGTIASLIESGWAEPSTSPSGIKRLTITPLGIEALDAPLLSSPAKRPALKILKPRLTPMKPRLKSGK